MCGLLLSEGVSSQYDSVDSPTVKEMLMLPCVEVNCD